MKNLLRLIMIFMLPAPAYADLQIEAENGLLKSPMQKQTGFILSSVANRGTAEFQVPVAASGNYILEVKTRHTSLRDYKIKATMNAQSRELRLKSGDPNLFTWQTGSQFRLSLPKGTVKLQLLSLTANTQIDAFRLYADGSTPPQDTGSETPPPVETPPPYTGPAPGGPERENLLLHLVGFGQGTTGGKGGTVCRVTSLENTGAGTLRACAEKSTSPKWVVFDKSGTITLSSPLLVANNTTIDGRGAAIVITGRGISLANRQNVIIHNIEVRNVADDGITIYKAKNIWIDHVTVSNTTDGAIDITEQSSGVTVSWSKMTAQNKTMLIGANNGRVEDKVISVTLHHNYYFKTERRNPLVRFARVHMFNNVLSQWGVGSGGDAIAATMESQLYVENNVFDPGVNAMGVRLTIPNHIPDQGYIKLLANWEVRNSNLFENRPELVFDPNTLYRYQPEVANQSLADRVVGGAGRQNQPYW